MFKIVANLFGVLLGSQPAAQEAPPGGLDSAIRLSRPMVTEVSVRDDGVHFVGIISETSVGSLDLALRGWVDKKGAKPILFIQSPGGDARAFSSFISVVGAYSAKVHVTGNCSSLCAEMLLLVPHQVILDPGSKIKYHLSPLAVELLLLKHGVPIPDCIKNNASLYRERFFASVAADTFANLVIDLLTFEDFIQIKDSNSSACQEYAFRSRHSFVTFPPESLSGLTNGRIGKERK